MPSSRRIEYAGSVHDEREIEAVVSVLRGGPTALRIGRKVRAMEARVAEPFGKRAGVMCNSSSSASYLAIELPGPEPGDEIGLELRGRRTGTRSDIRLTSFALSHIITAAGTGGGCSASTTRIQGTGRRAIATEAAGRPPLARRPIRGANA